MFCESTPFANHRTLPSLSQDPASTPSTSPKPLSSGYRHSSLVLVATSFPASLTYRSVGDEAPTSRTAWLVVRLFKVRLVCKIVPRPHICNYVYRYELTDILFRRSQIHKNVPLRNKPDGPPPLLSVTPSVLTSPGQRQRSQSQSAPSCCCRCQCAGCCSRERWPRSGQTTH